jgi:Zn-dependent protease with chaperone function
MMGMLLAGCEVTTTPAPQAPGSIQQPSRGSGSAQMTKSDFAAVVARVEPVAESVCRQSTRGVNCDFLIRVDPNPRAPANAYQSLDPSGRPVVTFTEGIIKGAQNRDELAFVLGHEASHHIQGHLARQAENAAAGAIIFAGLATLTGGNGAAVASAQELGAAVGARSYSKEFELEADRLGTVITHKSGYDPLVGAQYFTRIPDPGNRFLGSHPPNAARVEAVRQTAAGL